MKHIYKIVSAPFIFFSFCLLSHAQELSVQAVVQHTLDANPDIQASLRDVELAQFDVDAAQGAWRPTVDLTASSAYVDRNYGLDEQYAEHQGRIALSQLLYDGSLTYNNIRSLKQGQVVRLYELYSQVEQSSQEAVLAYLDILQYRELLATAEENLRTHVSVYKQVEQSAAAGVARRADLEQINGRLSLAESNVITEQSNLHDVSARFLRVTGIDPNLPLIPYAPATTNYAQLSVVDVLLEAYQSNPALQASIYNIDARQFDKESARGLNHPVVRLDVSYGSQSRDESGLNNTITEARAGVTVTYNLYNGGRDSIAIASAMTQINQAKDLRDRACRDMRQTIQIAFNDIRNLDRQLPSLNEHRLSSARVRTAYMGQFKLSQRTLLDLLDSENEAYEAARAYTEATYTQYKAVIRLLAARGELVASLGLLKSSWPKPEELAQRPVNYDPKYICPALETTNLGATGNILTQDTDLDGVIDLWDECANTAAGIKVDVNGCPAAGSKAAAWSQPPATISLVPSANKSAEPIQLANNDLASVTVEQTLSLPISFDKNNASFEATQIKELSQLLTLLNNDPSRAVIVEGHTSIDGSADYNLKLGQKRADAVAKWLVNEGSIAAERVVAVSYGERRPIAAGNSESVHRKNRRIEAKIVSLRDIQSPDQ